MQMASAGNNLQENIKDFQVIRRNNKTCISYRRFRDSIQGIAHYNETDDTEAQIGLATMSELLAQACECKTEA